MKLSKKKPKKNVKPTAELDDKDIKTSGRQVAPIFIFTSVLAFILPIAVSAFVLNNHYVIKTNADIAQRTANTYSALQVNAINNTLTQYYERLNRIASLPQLQESLATARHYSEATLTTLAQELITTFPHGKSLRFIPPNSVEEVELGGEFPIRYAGIDLIRNTLHTNKPTSEAVKMHDIWHIVLTHPVNDKANNTVGLIYLIIDTKLFDRVLSQNTKGIGQTQLIQQHDKQSTPHIIISAGKGNITEYATTSTTNNKIWSVKFTPTSQYYQKLSIDNRMIIISITACCAFFLLVFLISYAKFSASLANNLKQLSVFLEDLITGKAPEEPAFGFPQIQHILARLIALKPRAASEIDLIQAAFGSEHTDKDTSDEDILDIDVSDDDQDLLGLDDDTQAIKLREKNTNLLTSSDSSTNIDTIYRAYDIRGIAATQLIDAYVVLIGKAIGSLALDQGQPDMIVGADARNSSPTIRENLVKGILSTGCNVIDIGTVPSPVLYFATHTLNSQSGVIITASHNAAEYNGFKIIINGKTLFDNNILGIKTRIDKGDFRQGDGSLSETNVTDAYIERICSDVALGKSVKIVVDCGNGVAGNTAPRLFEELGCHVIPLYCELDGNFPNHQPDPSVLSNLQDLVEAVKKEQADLGVALDGDGDRITVVTAQGKIIMPDRLLMLFAKDIVARNPGTDVLFDVKCTRRLNSIISTYGGRPVMWKTGHSFMKEKMIETGALLAGEFSGHIFFKERWYGFDDGLYAAARLLEILTIRDQDIDSVFASFPDDAHTPEILVKVDEDKKFKIVEELTQKGNFGDGKITTIDGIRIDFSDGWGLVRASNTNPAITLRYEADTEEALDRIRNTIQTQLLKIDSSLSL